MTWIYKVRFLLKTIFLLPGTFMHELLHYVGLKLFGFADVSLTLMPRKLNAQGEYVMGSARGLLYEGQSSVRWIVPALIPKIWWVALYFLLSYNGLFAFEYSGGDVGLYFFFGEVDYASLEWWGIAYLALQLWWAGTLSFQDWVMAARGVLTPAGLTAFAVVIALPLLVLAGSAA